MVSAGVDRWHAESEFAYGPNRGMKLILDALERYDVRGTFFVPGLDVTANRGVLEQVIDSGHEVALHGHRHISPVDLDMAEEAAELQASIESVRSLGTEPRGYRSPSWEASKNTVGLLEEMGLRYSSQSMSDIFPFRHPGRRLIELPVQWMLDDYPFFGWGATRPIHSTAQVEEIWVEEWEAIADLGGLVVLTSHPPLVGRPSRVRMLERLLDRARAAQDLWIAPCGEIADHVDQVLN